MAEERAVDAFVDLASALVGDYEVGDFLELLVLRCCQVLDVTTGGVLLESERGELRLAAALSEDMHALEQAEIDHHEGPCHEAYLTRQRVVAHDLYQERQRWPSVSVHMEKMGLRAVYALPLRVRNDTIGALNLYRDTAGAFADDDIRLAQAFADVAAMGIVQERKASSAERRAAQLQEALDSRVVLEQAKGIISAQLYVSVQDAFDKLRRHARSNNKNLHAVARSVIDHGVTAIDEGS